MKKIFNLQTLMMLLVMLLPGMHNQTLEAIQIQHPLMEDYLYSLQVE
jgi:hypothetical protein